MRKIIYYLSMFFCGAIAIVSFVSSIFLFKDRYISSGFTLIAFMILFLLILKVLIKKYKLSNNEIANEYYNPYISEEEFKIIDRGELVTINTNDFICKPNESCYYGDMARRVINKTETIGYTGKSSGISIRIAKGLSYRTGVGKSTPIKEDVEYSYEGSIFITNQRVIFTSIENGFEFPLSKLTSMKLYINGIGFQVGNKSYTLVMENQEYPYNVISQLTNGAKAL
ncbi:hypothetical protein NZ45_16010 [Clostridium botulinum]|uniref:Uncharacterized protein n=1 Tax=Clostridium botulinum TaxID=1491 RepID=A0ABD7CHK1_CLOBO|nr:hypothetical protein [Clostridium botulinum]KGO12763.1 hypothetical protein NZ45_16010 [Clostridium botulinum]QRI52845.1 hypothetical protein JQS73_15625 [Clostridium botulinum]